MKKHEISVTFKSFTIKVKENFNKVLEKILKLKENPLAITINGHSIRWDTAVVYEYIDHLITEEQLYEQLTIDALYRNTQEMTINGNVIENGWLFYSTPMNPKNLHLVDDDMDAECELDLKIFEKIVV